MANVRNSAGINDKGGKNVNPVNKAVNTVTSYIGNVAREIRDIPTAVGTAASTKNANYLRDLSKQAGDVKNAVTKNEKGSTAFVKAKTGDSVTQTGRGSNKGHSVTIGGKWKGKLPGFYN